MLGFTHSSKEIALAAAALAISCATAMANDEELGRVRWQHDLDRALLESKTSGKPVFALFQEIPGCATCKRFGNEPLSNPLLVEAIEASFVPVAINNRPGKDGGMLERFGEPSLNNPVVRFLASDGRDLVARRDGVYTSHGIAERMVAALVAAKRDVPKYLVLAVEETANVDSQTATFGVSCYWAGEARLGSIDGVVATRAGWLGGGEAVEVRFDPRRLAYRDLARAAVDAGAANPVFAHDDAQMKAARAIAGARVERASGTLRDVAESERKYYLKHSKYAGIALTPLQAQRINAALGLGRDPDVWLSPRQLRELGTREPARSGGR